MKSTSNVQPWFFIPTLYFAEGLPYILINSVSVIIYKNLGVDNAKIAFWTSLLYLPWVIKMFWSPWVEKIGKTKDWIILTQLAMFTCLGITGLVLQLPNFFYLSLVTLAIAAFISATHDIAVDGFYLEALNFTQQAQFAGIRPIFYRGAVIFGSGFLVVLAGKLANQWNNVTLSWTTTLSLSALIFLALSVYHYFYFNWSKSLQYYAENLAIKKTIAQEQPIQKQEYLEIITSYFRKSNILMIVAFIVFYRFGEALLIKLSNPFLLDTVNQGGLGLATEQVGLIYGGFGVISLIVGGILGGFLIAKYGLQKSILPMTLALNLPNLLYFYMSIVKPSLPAITVFISLEQFGSGLGLTAFMVYLMEISEGNYKTAHYAISTGIMALGMMLPGLISGYIQEQVGYSLFFLISCLLTIPGIILIFFIPIKSRNSTQES
ncbi:major facilitator transporter [Rippkaea orientalis PCC 8801]|uniref:Major facilitator transporter n=1 Tax=Rippkaea orientalis (strain PCC 8801 / RF-1) TaxID=41431 RepID=B7JVY0_RIPO1|nr:MFS transporter [Rippkaea orientalis]ACK65669.1 major facilitator transporter [Rippkaea orientalis PCC 8801]